jgi:hypothetical protein
MVDELMERREIGHRSHFRRGMVADWVEEPERLQRYLRRAAKRIKIDGYKPKANRGRKRNRNAVRRARRINERLLQGGLEYLPPDVC